MIQFLTQSQINSIFELYIGYFNRAPEASGFNYWSQYYLNALNTGKSELDTQKEMANQFYLAAIQYNIYTTGSTVDDFIKTSYLNALGRTSVDAEGMSYWKTRLEQGTVSRGDFLQQVITDAKSFVNHASYGWVTKYLDNRMAVAKVFAANNVSTGEAAIQAGQVALSVVTPATVQAGQTPTQAIEAAKLPTGQAPFSMVYSSTAMVESGLNDGSISTVITITLTGDTFVGNLGANLGKVSGAPAGLTASLTKATDSTATLMLTGNAKAHDVASSIQTMAVTFGSADFVSKSIVGKAGLTQAIAVSFFELPLREVGGALTLSGGLSSNIVIDLAAEKIYFGGVEGTLASGSMANVMQVNAKGLTGTKVTASVLGDQADNIIYASNLGGTMTGGGGADLLTAGGGVDQFIFADTPQTNGVDTISGFKLGLGGDVLNFSAFLNKTGTAHIKPVQHNSTEAVTWENGDVLIATGNALETPAAIAALFGTTGMTNRAFAQPSVAAKSAPAKAVVITSDIVGDAKIWYLINQTGTSTVDETEITLVGILKDINNLGLASYGLVATNFA